MCPCLVLSEGRIGTAWEMLGELADRRCLKPLSRECLKDARFGTWRYCLCESFQLSCADEGSAVTCLQPYSALSAWIFFASGFSELGMQRVPTGAAHLLLVKQSLHCADKGSPALRGEQDGVPAARQAWAGRPLHGELPGATATVPTRCRWLWTRIVETLVKPPGMLLGWVLGHKADLFQERTELQNLCRSR